jgi:hypothetical protein
MISESETLLEHKVNTSMSSLAPSAVFAFETPQQALAVETALRHALIDQEIVAKLG